MRRLAYFLTVLLTVLFVAANLALAEEGAAQSGGANYSAFAACFGIAIAAFGGAFAQGRAAAAALDGIARNPGAAGSMFTPMILGLVFIETLVLFTFVVILIKA